MFHIYMNYRRSNIKSGVAWLSRWIFSMEVVTGSIRCSLKNFGAFWALILMLSCWPLIYLIILGNIGIYPKKIPIYWEIILKIRWEIFPFTKIFPVPWISNISLKFWWKIGIFLSMVVLQCQTLQRHTHRHLIWMSNYLYCPH